MCQSFRSSWALAGVRIRWSSGLNGVAEFYRYRPWFKPVVPQYLQNLPTNMVVAVKSRMLLQLAQRCASDLPG